ncbi:MAG: hypothetical protein AB7E61_06395 [Acholeplasmataceae bacterium]
MYISIYKKIFNVIASTPPIITADASNLGQILSGSGNSLWQCKSQTIGSITESWDIVSIATPVAPTRTPLASDVGANVTAADGSIWTAVQSSSSQELKWVDTGLSTLNKTDPCVVLNSSCLLENSQATSCYALGEPGEDPEYKIFECQYVTTYTYTWQLVQPRVSCASCPPTSAATDGDQCYCSNNDSVYEYTYENTQTTTYYWQKIRDDTELGISIENLIKHVSGNLTRMAIEYDEGSFEGILDSQIDDPFIFTLHDDVGSIIYSGFIKNWDYDEQTKKVSFDPVDFRIIFDTQVILDFSHDETFDSALSVIFEKVTSALNQQSGNINYQFTIPEDLRLTSEVSNYSDQYIVVNAKEFLKVYLIYFEYYINIQFDPDTLTIHAIFTEAETDIIDIKLDDFIFEKTQTSIQFNHTQATIKFQTIYDIDSEWSAATVTDFNTAASEDKGTLIADELPPLDGYSKDFVLRLIKNAYFEEITETEYDALSVKQEVSIKLTSGDSTPGIIVQTKGTTYNLGNQARYVTSHAPLIQLDGTPVNEISQVFQSLQVIASDNAIDIDTLLDIMGAYEVGSQCSFDKKINLYWNVQNIYGTFRLGVQACDGYIQYSCPVSGPTLAVIQANFNPSNYLYEQGLKVQYLNSEDDACSVYTYVKVSSNTIEYWKKGGTLVVPRPESLATKNYYLGSDNNIYTDSIPDELKIYPVQTKIFEYDTIAKSQIEAIYELISSRWNENIKINNLKKPIDLDKDFLQKIRVYDKNGNSKILPISEKSFEIKEIITNQKIKLGFKKDFFWQVYNGNEAKGVLK